MELMAAASNTGRLDDETQQLKLKQIMVASKLIEAYQKGLETLTKFRTAGR